MTDLYDAMLEETTDRWSASNQSNEATRDTASKAGHQALVVARNAIDTCYVDDPERRRVARKLAQDAAREADAAIEAWHAAMARLGRITLNADTYRARHQTSPGPHYDRPLDSLDR